MTWMRRRSPFIGRWLFAVALPLLPRVAAAQTTVTDPRVAEFDPSADHNAVGSTGQPVVTRYDLGFYLAGAAQPFQIIPLGKPTIDPDGKIRRTLSSLVIGWPLPGTSMIARVSAGGPGGTSQSAASNTFLFTTQCSSTVSPMNPTTAAGGGSSSLSVTALVGCAWTGTSNVSWVTVTSGASGSGNGSVGYSVAANTTASSRTGTLKVAGQTVTVTQQGTPPPSCTYSISPTSASPPASGASGTVTVTAPAGCGWTASSNATWVTFPGGASGSGNGTVGYTVAANSTTSTRTTTLTIAGRPFTVSQAAAPCTYQVSPTSFSMPSAGGTDSVAVTTSSGCGWSVSGGASWVTITSGVKGSGNGTVGLRVAANTTASSRTATLTIATRPVTISQAGPCAYSVEPTSVAAPPRGGSGNVIVTTTSGCAWTASSSASWLRVTSGASGTGNGTVAYETDRNSASTTRTAQLTIGGQAVTFTQPTSRPNRPRKPRVIG
jgi:hypothetical protein